MTTQPDQINTLMFLKRMQTVSDQLLTALDNMQSLMYPQGCHRFAQIVENCHDAIIGMTFDGKITTWNQGAENLFGHQPHESVGRNLNVLLPGSVELNGVLEKFEMGDCPEVYETSQTNIDGRKIEVAARLSPIKNLYGRMEGISVVFRDITRRKELEELAIKDAKRLAVFEQREEFMATLTHDLKNPLIGANQVLEILAKRELGIAFPKEAQMLLSIRDSNNNLLSMIHNLSEIYRIENEDTPIVEEFNLCDVLLSALKDVQQTAKEKSIVLKAELPPKPPTIRGDAAAIRRVVDNLLGNALKFCVESDEVSISVREEPGNTHGVATADFMVVEVKDTGPGISTAEQECLFQRFGQGALGKRYAHGTGLGLYLCKQIIESHKGRIQCQSTEGVGSIFQFILPTMPAGKHEVHSSSDRSPVWGPHEVTK